MQVSVAGTMIPVTAGRASAVQATQSVPDLVWHDVRDWGVEGRGWPADQMARYFDRLPARAEGVVREAVWNLSRDSAGMLTGFHTDATEIHVRYRLFRDRVAMSHMPATGVSGIDLYGRELAGVWRWVGVTRPESQEYSGRVTDDLDPWNRAYRIYLPLYNGIDALEIGVARDAEFQPSTPRSEKPILFYGTSITHGACASRPGMCHPSILGRRLDLPVIDLGFSGNGRMEPEVGALLSELDPAVYVIDCLPNMTPEEVGSRTEPLIRQLRAARPTTPIVLVEDRTFGYAWIKARVREQHRERREQLQRVFARLQLEGMADLYYLEGDGLLGDDSEGTTDGSHPSDLGFFRQANAFEPVLREALGR